LNLLASGVISPTEAGLDRTTPVLYTLNLHAVARQPVWIPAVKRLDLT
jgi:hypothetical protein